MATNNVLDLPELLENILLQLPMRDLLFAQKVCKTWKLTIDTTLSIQKALFFAPGMVKDIAYIPPTHIPVPKWLGTPNSARREFSYSDRLAAQECQSYIKSAGIEGYALNPLLVSHNDGEVDFRHGPWYIDAEPMGSWVRMFVTQPPGSTLAETQMKRNDATGNMRVPRFGFHSTKCGDRFGELVKQHRSFVGKVQRSGEIGTYRVVGGRPKLVDPRVFDPAEGEEDDEYEDEGEEMVDDD
ncbi:hypothetical protein LTR56_021814 [Elasticomyces elasticus]|nr:hypothetical protein LTR56_021814 [Elasticomyces elasticus]KAK3650861.1 hypothetical protein LTR22_012337 [Elasticomyces elasticus]KAK4906998.1 hypothetical protein LTR49_023919 [Elasticomyces elasticus]